MAKKQVTTWMWATDHGVNGVDLDLKKGVLHWYDQLGCACDDSYADQTIAQFQEKGFPGGLGDLPDDILGELKHVIAQL